MVRLYSPRIAFLQKRNGELAVPLNKRQMAIVCIGTVSTCNWEFYPVPLLTTRSALLIPDIDEQNTNKGLARTL